MSKRNSVHEPLRRVLVVRVLLSMLTVGLLLAGCVVGSDTDATPTPESVDQTPTIPAIPPTATVELTPTLPPTLQRLLDPGPTAPGPEQIIFQNGEDLWTINVAGEARRLTDGITLGAWSQTVSGTLAAFVQERPNGDLTIQEVRFVSVDGPITGAVFGPITVTGPDAVPEIVELAWSWGTASLALLRSDGTVDALIGLDDPFRDSSIPIELVPPGEPDTRHDVVWGPGGEGVALIESRPGSGDALILAPLDVTPFDVLDAAEGPRRTVADFVWLPGRGRLAFVESSSVPGSRAPASIFTIVPDGSALELLVSASRFAPAATIGGMEASPDGRELAFLLYTPDRLGRPAFASMWVLHIDSGELREVPIVPGYVATEMWFMAGGVLWRGVDIGADGVDGTTTYSGVEPFILAFSNDEGNTRVLFQSTLVEDEE